MNKLIQSRLHQAETVDLKEKKVCNDYVHTFHCISLVLADLFCQFLLIPWFNHSEKQTEGRCQNFEFKLD